MSIFLFIRHGHTNAGNRLVGRLPHIHLTNHGLLQAHALAEDLAPISIDAIFSSPLERAMETARPLSIRTEIETIPDPEFLEVDYGDWTGFSFDDLDSDPLWKQYHSFRSGTRIPGGELMTEVQLRMVRRIMALHSQFPGSTFAVVSHADPIRAVLCGLLGISLDLSLRLRIDTGSVSMSVLHDWGAEVLCVNRRPAVSLEP